jgi:hypothetical protein
MRVKTARDVINVAKSRGLRIIISPRNPRRLSIVRPQWVPEEEVSPGLIECVKAWRPEIIEELQAEVSA